MDIRSLLPGFDPVPAAPFLMGTPERDLSALAKQYGGTRESYREESPQHTVRLPAFAIARTPVTNALYAAYVAATDAPPPLHWHGPRPPAERGEHPLVNVSWDDAQALCVWLNAMADLELPLFKGGSGKAILRLPSEAEWEHAARGSDGRSFPWGNTFAPHYANTRETGNAATTPVGAYTAGVAPYGTLDMAGNVWEWTASLDRTYPYDPGDGREARHAAGRRILRGGCYANPQGFARCACRFRLPPTIRNEFIGVRLAYSLTTSIDDGR